MIVERIRPIIRIQMRRRQCPLDIRRAQRREMFAELGSEPVQLFPWVEGVVAPNPVSAVVHREAVLWGVDEISVITGPFVQPFLRAEVAEASVGSGFGGKRKFAGKVERA